MKKVLSLILWLAIIKFIIFVSELTDAYALVLSIIIVGIPVLLYVSLLIFLRIPKKVKTLAGLYDTYVTINEWKAIYKNTRHKLLPLYGVYITEVEVDEKKYQGVVSIGVRPTVNKDIAIEEIAPSVEVNIFEFYGDLYGKKIKLRLKKTTNSLAIDCFCFIQNNHPPASFIQ
jgi:hypothetical protein